LKLAILKPRGGGYEILFSRALLNFFNTNLSIFFRRK